MSQTFDNTTRIPTFNRLKKSSQQDDTDFFHTAFVELLAAHLSKKNQDFIVFFSRDICKTKMSSKLFYHARTKHYHRGCSF
jgi:hypothetical protein